MTDKIVVNGQAQNVFSQILASLVALGYQVQQFLGDAWNLGSSQSRSRVFIVASAPGTIPLHPPLSTHGHPPGKGIKRNLGRTTNGLPFGIRRWENTPFP
jgi:DNA (cytosine-5)-methyltransferase 1